jgi:hypothetical protein
VKRLIELTLIALLTVFSANAIAKQQPCADLGLEQAFPPVEQLDVVGCFVFKPRQLRDEGQISTDPDGLALYGVTESSTPALIYEFPYAGTEGSIEGAFYQSVENEKFLLVIHKFDPPRSWDVVSDLYDVSVFRLESGGLVHDEKLSRFFGLGGELADEKGKIVYRFPYTSELSVKRAVSSDLFKAVVRSALIKGIISGKTFLYEGNTEPRFKQPSKMYLVPGDIVEVVDSTGGWCKISYLQKSRSKRLERWTPCSNLDVSSLGFKLGG